MNNLARVVEDQDIKKIRDLRDLKSLNPRRLEESIKYINKIHEADDGYITLAVKDEGEVFHQWCYDRVSATSDEVLDYFHSLKTNTYASINSFFIPARKTTTLRRINALYVDIDKHTGTVNKDMVQDLIEHLHKNYYNKFIPKPSITVSTGRGIQLIFLLEHLPNQALKFWQNIENELAKRLSKLNFNGFKLDESCTDVTRVFRLPGTINTKSRFYAEILEINDNIYRLDELKKEHFKYIPKTNRKRKAKVLNITAGQSRLNTYELHWKRREDIERLRELRNGDCEGLRETMCFLYRYYSCLVDNSCNKALDKMLKFNQKFSEPLPLHEVIKATESAEKAYKEYCESINENKESTIVFENGEFKLKGYNYTNTKLIKILKITLEEQKELLILIGKKEKYRRKNKKRTPRNQDGLTQKQQELEELKVKVKELKEQGLKQSQIIEILEITIYKYKKLM